MVGVPVGVIVADGDEVADGDAEGDAEEEVVGLGDADGEALVLVLGLGLGVGVALADGLVEGERDGVAGAEVVPCAGPTRFGPCTGWWPVNSSARAAMATPRTATAPPVATPAANERRSRRYSVVRRSRSQAGSAARRAAQLLTGAAAMPRVGKSSSPASSGPLSWFVFVRAPAMPRNPNRARMDSAQLARSASHHFVRSLVFGVRRNAALRANRPSTDARATTSEVDCQMKKAPIASRHDAPVPRRTRVTARTSPSSTITGTAATRNTVSLRNSWPPPVARLAAPASRKMKKNRPSRSPYHCAPPAR